MILKRQEKDNIVKAMYDSSNILASTYDTNTNDLTLIFKSGTQYKYPNVSKSDYMRFEIAESQGKVFNTHIKKYTFEKLDNVDVSMILESADDLKAKEEAALYEAKKIKLIDKMKYACHVDDSITLGKNTTNEAKKLFKKTLEEIQVLLTDFLTPKA